MESDVAFNFLKHLVDVTVQNCHRTEALQISESTFAVASSPAPFGIHRPKRDMREHYYRRFRTKTFQVILEPLQLVVTQLPQAASLKIERR